MYNGKVKWFNAEMGFGFITREDNGVDVFAHFSYILADGYKSLEADQIVSFDINKSDKGDYAANISVIYQSEENE
ncbi:cold-shock protein [Paenibacillus sp. LHD-38]|uniref:cold-shock protein n=1 Tax=Paenibacillus sp. LHD-38 TaxID=3072143 RepID=UPI00280CF3D4|nr:cold-shock protein [Paenibacillus sp. LHD-38]MDQ8733204.1 cold-shock protein [Paenibacillus sp. LHD-38]